ncbi:MAG TPA: GNAT family N-acetyltransferase [Terriglobales bacterium]|nr:GNAT family N-acetyltransferase [Terriglobales bacterium]
MHSLDNPIWEALITTHASFAETYKTARRFPREVSMVAGFPEPTPDNYAALAALVSPGETVGLFLQQAPNPPAPWSLVSSGPLLQMLCEKETSASPAPWSNGTRSIPKFIRLTQSDVPEMLALTKLTKPGPFGPRTHEMGDYFGIRNSEALAAMAGERLRIPGYTEISAVCTHPDHTGHGYASALMSMLMERICGRGELPFLHVRPENTRAVQVYERLGFTKRAALHYVVLRRMAE